MVDFLDNESRLPRLGCFWIQEAMVEDEETAVAPSKPGPVVQGS